MYCKHCGNELKTNDRFCSFCGTEVTTSVEPAKDTSSANTNSNTTSNQKKKMSPAKIIILVVVGSALIHALLFGLTFGIFALADIDPVDIFRGDFDDRIEDYFEGVFDDDDIEDYFEDIFGEDSNVKRRDKNKGNSEKAIDTSGLKRGKIDKENRSYSSQMTGISFVLPKEWEVLSYEELKDLNSYIEEDKFYVDDFYAEDSLKSTMLCISYYNKDYYPEYKDLKTFTESIKEGIKDSFKEDIDDYTLDFADDSKIKIADKDYNQIAVMVTSNYTHDSYYSYEFLTEVDGYYVEISLLGFSLDEVGKVIELIK